MNDKDERATEHAVAYNVQFADADGVDCGCVYSTVLGEVCLQWGYGDEATKIFMDPKEAVAVSRALRLTAGAAW